MNKKYKTSQLYLVKLAQITKIIPSSPNTKGSICFRQNPEMYFAKLIKKDVESQSPSKNDHYFKILTKNLIVYDKHTHTQIGDFFVYEKTPVSMIFDEDIEYIDFKSMRPLEHKINNFKNKDEHIKG